MRVRRPRRAKNSRFSPPVREVGLSRLTDRGPPRVKKYPGVHTQGETLEEARENLRDALERILEANRELDGQENETTTREEMLLV